ncbi:MAG: hypothetical protein AAFN59_00475 [Pseudomonadota bacterium]
MSALDFVAYENRREEQIGLRLLALSLEKEAPEAILHIVSDPKNRNDEAWFEERGNVRLIRDISVPMSGWDIKPFLLLHLLDRGFERITWIDADILVARPIAPLFRDLGMDTLLATMEPRRHKPNGLRKRAIGLGLDPGPDEQPFSVNSCIVSATQSHRQLLLDWLEQLDRQDYRASQKVNYVNRPFFFRSDQELLSGLLGSSKHADVPLRVLNDKTEIAQCSARVHGDFSFRSRIRSAMSGGVYFVHSPAINVWDNRHIRERNFVMGRGLHPVRMVALRFQNLLPEEERHRLDSYSVIVAFFVRLARMDPSLTGAPLALTSLLQVVRKFTRRVSNKCRRDAKRALGLN